MKRSLRNTGPSSEFASGKSDLRRTLKQRDTHKWTILNPRFDGRNIEESNRIERCINVVPHQCSASAY